MVGGLHVFDRTDQLGQVSQTDQAVMRALHATGASQTQPHIAHWLTGDYDNNGIVDAADLHDLARPCQLAWRRGIIRRNGPRAGLATSVDDSNCRDARLSKSARWGGLNGGLVPHRADQQTGGFDIAARVAAVASGTASRDHSQAPSPQLFLLHRSPLWDSRISELLVKIGCD